MSQYVRTAVIEGFDNAPPLDTSAPIELQFAVDSARSAPTHGLS